jgi:hypothetical protein
MPPTYRVEQSTACGIGELSFQPDIGEKRLSMIAFVSVT